jgi:hypothetical protein
MRRVLTLRGTATLLLVSSAAGIVRMMAIVGTIIMMTAGIEAKAQSTRHHAKGTGSSIENSEVHEFHPMAPTPLGEMGVSSFDSYLSGRTLGLRWETVREVGTQGFTVERALAGADGMYDWKEIAYIPGNWDSPVGRFYIFLDKDRDRDFPQEGAVLYRLKQIGRNGETRYSNPLKVAVSQESARIPLRHD